MLQPVQQKFARNIDELFKSDVNILTTPDLDQVYGINPDFQKRAVNLTISMKIDQNWTHFYIKNNLATQFPCGYFANKIQKYGNRRSYKGMYLIPETSEMEVRNFFVYTFHPFLEKFQNIMDLSIEFGLHKAWERLYYEYFNTRWMPQAITPDEENDILDFDAILPFFLILAFGYLIALFALLCEIFYHDFLSIVFGDYLKEKLDVVLRRNVKQGTFYSISHKLRILRKKM